MKSTKLFFVLGIVVSLIAGGCGGGGGGGSGSGSGSGDDSSSGDDTGGGSGAGGGTGSALTVVERVSVVDAASSGSSSLSEALFSIKQAVSDLPADSGYNTDETFVFVEERSTDVFDVINEILCMMDQTRYGEMVNTGDYLAYVDITQCEKENDSVEGKGTADDSSGGNRPEYEEWNVNSYRADDNSPHVVAVWIHMGGDEFEPPMIIYGRTEITEARSDENPYGIFQMNFKAFNDDGDATDTTVDPIMTGYLMTERNEAGTVLLKFFDNADFGGGEGYGESVTLSREGSSIHGTMSASENFSGESREKEFQIAANDSYFYRTYGGDNVCLSRTDFDETVHRYNLYTTETDANPGSLVTRNSGFPITFTNDNDAEERFYGWMGYWGIWLPEEAGLETGDTVNRETYGPEGPEEGTPYTAVIVPGKLKKHTRNTVTLEEIHGIPLHWSKCNFEMGECDDYIVEWDKNSGTLLKTALMNKDNWIPENITSEEVAFTEDDWDFSFWSDSLGGNGQVALKDPETGELAALANSSVVVFYKEDVVIPGNDDAPTDLVCFQECPDPADPSTYLEASRWEAGDDSFERRSDLVAPGDLVAGTHYAAYAYDAASGLLKSGDIDIVTEVGGEFDSGIWTGQMVRPEDLGDLACDWNPDETCAWKVWNQVDVTYSWETGPNEWNQFSALQDPSTGEFLEFEPPLFLEYVHTDGVKYYVEYGGPGDLYGFPGMCVNMDTGTEVDCGDWSEDTPIRWVTAINAPDGSAVTDTTTGTQYYTKAMDKEQRMQAVEESLCTGAGLTFPDYELPDESLWEDPVIGDEPYVEVPAVIGGVLQ